MKLFTVAIVGRPNVGKSSLLNAMARQRISIVEETPGITRDRVSTRIRYEDWLFELVDTGGIGIVDQLELREQVYTQIDIALEQADLILFILDIREGVTGLEEEIAHDLRTRNKPVLLVLNKADTFELQQNTSDFYRLGFGDPLAVSAAHHQNLDVLKETITEFMANEGRVAGGEKESLPEMKIALIGKTNTGKSTFLNQLAGEERTIVSEIPGTTRDSIDVRFERQGKTFIAIDTAGIRKSRAVDGTFEFYSQKRSERSIRRADVVLFFLDAMSKTSKVDKQIAAYIRDEMKPVVLVVNKWDLAGDYPMSSYSEYLTKTLTGISFAPIVFVTATEGRNVQGALDVAQSLWKQANHRVSTPQINKALGLAYQKRKPRPVFGKVGKFFYGTHTSVCPPTLVLFVNRPDLIDDTYRRYLENQFRKTLPYPEIPIRIFFRKRESEEAPYKMSSPLTGNRSETRD
jgi:GTP-binding protein